MTEGPPPQRIGDAERDRAVSRLTEHLTAGRLDQLEFDDRMGRALAARTQADLDPLFTDLPEDDSAGLPAVRDADRQVATSKDAGRRRRQIGTAVMGLLWPVALIACFATDWQYWWIILIPALGSGAIAALFGLDHEDDEGEDDEVEGRGKRPPELDR